MLAHNTLIKVVPHPVTSIPTLDFDNIIGSIFLIKSLLLAIIKEYTPTSEETAITIATLRQEIFSLEKKDKIYDIDFARIDTQFYLVLSQQHELKQLTKLMLKEKLHVDRMLRLFLRHEEEYKPIIRIYEDILSSIQLNNITSASNALCELAKTLEEYAFKAEKYYPEFFK